MSFYPTNYQPKESSGGDYMKLTEGDHRVRILAEPIIGFEYWYDQDGDRKVARVRTYEQAVADPRASESIKEFNAFVVWNYEEEKIQLLNVTQKAIQKAIYQMAQDADWGDPREYDIVIKRKGKTLNDTEYSVMPKPSKTVDPKINQAFNEVKIVVNEYFTGGHPIVRQNDENKPVQQTKTVEDDFTSEELADQIPF